MIASGIAEGVAGSERSRRASGISGCLGSGEEMHDEEFSEGVTRMAKPGNPDVPLTATTVGDPSRCARCGHTIERLQRLVTLWRSSAQNAGESTDPLPGSQTVWEDCADELETELEPLLAEGYGHGV